MITWCNSAMGNWYQLAYPVLEKSQYLAGDCLSAADITFAALVGYLPFIRLYSNAQYACSHLPFLESLTKKAISCIAFLQAPGHLEPKPCRKNCELRKPASMLWDCSRSNATLEHLFRSKKGVCLDYGNTCNTILSESEIQHGVHHLCTHIFLVKT
jgi:hypothetical protein